MNQWFQNDLVLASLLAFTVAVILTPVLRDIFRSYNIVDRPGIRRVHVYPIPRIGGIPIALAYCASLYMIGRSDADIGSVVWDLAPGAAVIFLVGLVDDFFNLSPLVKLGGQVLATILVLLKGVRIETLASIPGFPEWLSWVTTIIWLLLTTNALNLIDGLDGLCGGIGLLSTLTMFCAALLYGNTPLAYVTLPLALALAGFLFYNFHPATVFLGDSGALLIGFLLGCYGMIWTQKTSTLFSLLVPLLALSVPLLDVSVAIIRRMLRRQPIFGADRGHIHHRLLDRGLMPRTAVLWLYLFAGLAAGFALLLNSPVMEDFHNLLLVLLLGVFLMGLRELRYEEFRYFGQALLGGEIQKGIQEKIRLDHLGTALAEARTREDWWKALGKAAVESGWAKLCWVGPQGTLETVLSENAPLWTLQITLGEMGSLQVDGCTETEMNLTRLANVIRQNSTEPLRSP